ncbi:MAG: two-component regulator propeller domain-containing protein [Methanococcaceae archaeon]
MRNLAFILIILISISSCEKTGNSYKPGNPNTGFSLKILDNYFVKSIAFDSKGNAWIGTYKQGLIKYNPHETVIYNSYNSALPDDLVIWDIAVDSKDNVWIGCDGIIKYDGIDFTTYNTTNSPVPEDFVYSIAIDSKDNIWFTSCRFREGGFVKFDGTNWEVYTPENSALPVRSVKSIAIDNSDNVWLALSEIVNNTYLVKISGPEWTTYSNEDLGFVPYYFAGIDINSQNKVCGAIDYSLSGSGINPGPQAFIFDGTKTEQLRINDKAGIKSLTVDNEDNLWCAIYGGYAVYNGEQWIVDDSTFQESGVFTIRQANDNRIWLGTGDGIYIND